MKKEVMKDMVGIIFFFLVIILGVMAINERLEYVSGTMESVSLEK